MIMRDTMRYKLMILASEVFAACSLEDSWLHLGEKNQKRKRLKLNTESPIKKSARDVWSPFQRQQGLCQFLSSPKMKFLAKNLKRHKETVQDESGHIGGVLVESELDIQYM